MKKVKNFCLIGNPVAHSLSPLIHNFFIFSTKSNAGYVCFNVEQKDFGDFIDFLKNNFHGFNITVPYKETILSYLDEIDQTAEFIEAVNCVKITNGKLIGYNTDYFGVKKTFEIKKIDPEKKKIVLIGAGGASKPFLYFLKKMNYGELIIVNRTVEKAEYLKEKFQLDKCKIFSLDYLEKKETCDIIVNSSSIGLKGDFFIGMNIEVKEAAFDMQYSVDGYTPFLSKIDALHKFDGKIMLIYQAYQSFANWVGYEFDFDYKKIIEKMRG